MNQRTRILASLFMAAIAYVAVSRMIYPTWIRPLLTLDERIAERSKDLDKLQVLEKEVENARYEYRGFVERIGSFDPGAVETSVRDRLNGLIEKHRLQGASVTPSRPSEDRKTGLTTTVITVSAVGSLDSAINFLREVSEMPELVRVGNPAIYPASGDRKGIEKDMVNLRVPVKALVLPQQKIVGRIDLAGLKKLETFVRHADRDYSPIWKGTPFTEFVPLAPLRVVVQRSVLSETGQPAGLNATPSGGDGNYTFSWEPAEGLDDPTSPHPTLDTSAARDQVYTVTVEDGAESKPATATVTVSIREPRIVQVQPPPPQPPPPDPGPRRWPDARFMQVTMCLLRSVGAMRTNELMIYNTRTRETTYYRTGAEFDGGTLVYVHQTGGLVHRRGQYFVYPLGGTLEDHLEVSLASDHPELQHAAQRAEVKTRAKETEGMAGTMTAVKTDGTAAIPDSASSLHRPTVRQVEGDAAGGPPLAGDVSDSQRAADITGDGPPAPDPGVQPVPSPGATAQEEDSVGPGRREAPRKKPLLHRPSRRRTPTKQSGRL